MTAVWWTTWGDSWERIMGEDDTLSDAEGFRRRLRALVAAFTELALPTDPYGVLLGRGEFFAGATAVRSNPTVHAHYKRYRAKAKQCFYNCQWFVVCDHADLATYYEGYVTGPARTLIHHAWLVVGGMVLDPTLEATARLARKHGAEYPPAVTRKYFGVPFTKLDAAVNMTKDYCGPLLEDLTGIV